MFPFFPTGIRESEINVAEGQKQAQILASEAMRMENINRAQGEANAIIAKATARADAIERVAEAIGKEVCVLLCHLIPSGCL